MCWNAVLTAIEKIERGNVTLFDNGKDTHHVALGRVLIWRWLNMKLCIRWVLWAAQSRTGYSRAVGVAETYVINLLYCGGRELLSENVRVGFAFIDPSIKFYFERYLEFEASVNVEEEIETVNWFFPEPAWQIWRIWFRTLKCWVIVKL